MVICRDLMLTFPSFHGESPRDPPFNGPSYEATRPQPGAWSRGWFCADQTINISIHDTCRICNYIIV